MSKKNSGSPQKAAARTAAVQALYMIELMEEKPEKVVNDFKTRAMPEEAELPTDFDAELFESIVHRASAMQADVDAELSKLLEKGWTVARLEKILRAILRAGAAELLAGKGNAANIIDDYVNVAHAFFSGKEPAMTNAVLDKIAGGRKA